MDLECYAAFFALSPDAHAEMTRRVRDNAERTAAKQGVMEAKRVATELERVEK